MFTTDTTLTTGGFTAGTWYWQVRAHDDAANWSPWTSPDGFYIGTDTQKPTVPKNLSAVGNAGGANFTWTASTDNIAVDNYEVRYATNNKLTGATVKSTTATTLSVSGLANGTWYGQVRAKDVANNYSAWTPVVEFAVPSDSSELGLEEAMACAVDLIADCALGAFDSCGDVTRKFAGMLA